MQEFRGYGGTITVEDEHLLVAHRGAAAKRNGIETTTPRRIPLQALSDAKFKAATRLVNGWIALGIGGQPAPEPGIGAAAGDSNVVLFRHRDSKAFQGLYNWLLYVVRYNQEHGIDPRSVPFDAAPQRKPEPTAHATAPANYARMPTKEPDEPSGTEVGIVKSGIAPSAASSDDGAPHENADEPKPSKLGRKEKAVARDRFRDLALAAARGDHDALDALPAALDATRQNWRRGRLDDALKSAFISAVEDVSKDDILTKAEEDHLEKLAEALGVNMQTVLNSSPAALEQLIVCRINDGRPPVLPQPSIILKRNETAYASFAASLMKEVAQREMRGGGSSVSIPIGFGVRYRTGTARARSVVVGTQLVAEDAGELTVTSQRALFSGHKKTLEFRYDRLVALHQYTDGLRLGVTNRQAASLFRFGPGQSPTIAAALITRAASVLEG